MRLIGALIAGLGEALVYPALSAYYLDITAEEHRSRVMGFKESAAALGGVLGPLLIVSISGWTTPQQVFLIGLVFMVLTAVIAVAILRAAAPEDQRYGVGSRGYTLRQALAAQSALRSVVIQARSARERSA